MANQFQSLVYEGYLADEPEMRYTPAGRAVTNFRIGSNRQYKTSDGKTVKETTWLKITAWGKLGEIVNQYCGKGSHVIVSGILRVGENGSPNVYELRNGGYGASYEVTANAVRILEGKEGAVAPEHESDASEEEIPF